MHPLIGNSGVATILFLVQEQKIKCHRDQRDFRSSDKFENPYLVIPLVNNDNGEPLCALVSGTASGCWDLCNILVLLILLSEFYNHLTKMLAVSIDLQHSFSYHKI